MSNGKRAALTTKLPPWRTARHLETSKQSFATFADCLRANWFYTQFADNLLPLLHRYIPSVFRSILALIFLFCFFQELLDGFYGFSVFSDYFLNGVESCFLMERFCHRRSQIYQSTCGPNVMWWFISSFARTRKVWTVAFRFVIQIDNDCSKSWIKICSSAMFRKFARVNIRPIVSL